MRSLLQVAFSVAASNQRPAQIWRECPACCSVLEVSLADAFRRPFASGTHAAPPASRAGTQAAEWASGDRPLPHSISVASGVTFEAAARAAEQQGQDGQAASSSAEAGSQQGSFQDLIRESRQLQRQNLPRLTARRRRARKGANAKAEHALPDTSLGASKRSSSASEQVDADSLSILQPDAKRGE